MHLSSNSSCFFSSIITFSPFFISIEIKSFSCFIISALQFNELDNFNIKGQLDNRSFQKKYFNFIWNFQKYEHLKLIINKIFDFSAEKEEFVWQENLRKQYLYGYC